MQAMTVTDWTRRWSMEIDLVGQRMNARGVPEINGFRPGLHTHAKDLHLSAANFIHSHWQCTEVLHIHAVPDPIGGRGK